MSDATVIADGQAAHDQSAAGGRRKFRNLRIASIALGAALLVEYGLGIGVNRYLQVPAADQHHGFWTALGRALTSQPAALGVHAALGLLLLLGGLNLLVRAVLARHRIAVASSAVAFLALVGAAATGASFVDKDQAGASMGMAVLTGVALLCCVVNLFTAVPSVKER